MVEFTDIAGLGELGKRFLEVVAEGIGAASRPYVIRKMADARPMRYG